MPFAVAADPAVSAFEEILVLCGHAFRIDIAGGSLPVGGIVVGQFLFDLGVGEGLGISLRFENGPSLHHQRVEASHAVHEPEALIVHTGLAQEIALSDRVVGLVD